MNVVCRCGSGEYLRGVLRGETIIRIRGAVMSLLIDEKEIDSLPITRDPEVLSGTPVFRGTRVPVDTLLSNLKQG